MSYDAKNKLYQNHFCKYNLTCLYLESPLIPFCKNKCMSILSIFCNSIPVFLTLHPNLILGCCSIDKNQVHNQLDKH